MNSATWRVLLSNHIWRSELLWRFYYVIAFPKCYDVIVVCACAVIFVSVRFCLWLWTAMFVFEPFVMVWKNKGPNFSSNNPGEQEPLHHIWPIFHSSLYTPLCFLHPSNRPFLKHFASVSKQVWIRNHSYDFHLQIHFMIIKLSFSQRLVLKPRDEETFIHELLTGAFDWFLVLYWSLQGKLLNSEC